MPASAAKAAPTSAAKAALVPGKRGADAELAPAVAPKRAGVVAPKRAAAASKSARAVVKHAPSGRAEGADAPALADAAAVAALSTAGPAPRTRKPRARPAPPAPDRAATLVEAVRRSLEDDKAEAVVVLDVRDRASFTDQMIIATGLADRQIQAMATHLEEALAKHGMKLSRNAIQASPDWVLIDAGDLVIHLFKPEARQSYGLERMWGPDSPQGDARAEGQAQERTDGAD